MQCLKLQQTYIQLVEASHYDIGSITYVSITKMIIETAYQDAVYCTAMGMHNCGMLIQNRMKTQMVVLEERLHQIPVDNRAYPAIFHHLKNELSTKELTDDIVSLYKPEDLWKTDVFNLVQAFFDMDYVLGVLRSNEDPDAMLEPIAENRDCTREPTQRLLRKLRIIRALSEHSNTFYAIYSSTLQAFQNTIRELHQMECYKSSINPILYRVQYFFEHLEPYSKQMYTAMRNFHSNDEIELDENFPANHYYEFAVGAAQTPRHECSRDILLELCAHLEAAHRRLRACPDAKHHTLTATFINCAAITAEETDLRTKYQAAQEKMMRNACFNSRIEDLITIALWDLKLPMLNQFGHFATFGQHSLVEERPELHICYRELVDNNVHSAQYVNECNADNVMELRKLLEGSIARLEEVDANQADVTDNLNTKLNVIDKKQTELNCPYTKFDLMIFRSKMQVHIDTFDLKTALQRPCNVVAEQNLNA